jgi:thioesterase domain-containing protein
MSSEDLALFQGIPRSISAAPTRPLTSPLWRLLPHATRVITLLEDGGSALGFYCVHPITCDITPYVTLARFLASGQRVFGIQMPAANLNATLGLSIEALAGYYVDILTNFQPEGPLVLGGWSAGAAIALEMAQQLRARGREIRLLVVFDGVLFNTGWCFKYYMNVLRHPPLGLANAIIFGKEFGVFTREFPRRVVRKLWKFFRYSLTIFGAYASAQSDITDFIDTTRWPAQYLASVRGLYRALEEYVPKRYQGKTLNYVATGVPLSDLMRSRATWQKICCRAETIYVEGSHNSMLREPHIVFLAGNLRERLKQMEHEEIGRF